MAEKNATTQNAAPRDNWFDLHTEENNQDELKAKQWQTERRETDDEASIGNLHYGTETERDNLRETHPQQTMDPAHSDSEFSKTTLTDQDHPVPPELTADEPAASQARSTVEKTGSAPSAEALSGGNTAPLSTESPEIQRADTERAPSPQDGSDRDATSSTPPPPAAAGTEDSRTPGPATTQSGTETPESNSTDDPGQVEKPANHGPLAADDIATTDENSSIAIDVLANDSDADGDTLHITEVSVGDGQGMVGINDDGTIAFDPGADFNHLAKGETQHVEVAYTISDGHGGTSTATTTVTVTGINDQAEIEGSGTTVTEDTAQTVSGQLTIVDPDAGEAHFNAGTVEGTYGSLELAEDGSWSYALNNEADNVQQLDQGDTVTDTVTITSVDGTTHDLVMTVNGTNDSPVIKTITERAATEDGSPVTGSITATDIDADDSLTFSAADTDGLTFNQDGSYSFDPGHASYQAMAEGETRTISIPVTAEDGHGAADTQNLVITLTGTNDTPTVSGAVTLPGGIEDVSQSFSTIDLLANSDDIDTNDTLSITNVSVDPDQGILTTNTDGTFTFTPKENFNGEVTISYDVTDGIERVATSASINLEAANDAPVITNVTAIEVTEDSMEGFTGYGETWEGDVYSVITQEEMLEHLGITDVDSDAFSVSLANASPAWHEGILANDSLFTSETLAP